MQPKDNQNRPDRERKTVTIIVNGRKKEVEKDKISFEQVVALAFAKPPYGENTAFTVSWMIRNREGSLVEGESVLIKEGMVFDVTATDKS